jgi:NADH-quinone oxidoreductase subunit L
MTVPLIVLAVLTCVTGFVPFSHFVSSDGAPFAMHINWWIAASGIVVSLAGIAVAARLYLRESDLPARVAARWAGFWRAASHRFYIDRAWEFLARKVIFRYVSTPVARFDKRVVDGAVDGVATVTEKTSEAIRGSQSGRVQTYALVFVFATLAISVIALFI